MNRRTFTGHLIGGAGVAGVLALAGTSITLEGCGALDDLVAWVPVGLAAFDGMAAIVDAQFTTIAATVDALWAAVSAAISLYQHSTDPQNTRLDKLIAALDALAGGLTQALAALPISIPAAVLSAAKLTLALTIATLKGIRNRLQAPTPAPQAIYAAAAGTMPAKSTKDYINQVNKIWADAGQPLRVK